jgi:hypothetical protein
LVRVGGFFIGGGVVAAVWGVVVARRGDYLTAVTMAGFAVFIFSMMLAMTIVEIGRNSLRVVSDASGTVFRVDPVIVGLLYAALIAFIVSGILFVRFLPTGQLDIPTPSRGWQILAPVPVAGAVAIAVLGLRTMRARGGPGYVRLTPEGFEIANAVSTSSGAWADVTKVTDETADDKGRFHIVFCMKDGSEQVVNGADYLVPKGRALYWMVRHYWLHPEQRAELTDGRAVERLREGRFDLQ